MKEEGGKEGTEEKADALEHRVVKKKGGEAVPILFMDFIKRN